MISFSHLIIKVHTSEHERLKLILLLLLWVFLTFNDNGLSVLTNNDQVNKLKYKKSK